jgi:hypothetical protein
VSFRFRNSRLTSHRAIRPCRGSLSTGRLRFPAGRHFDRQFL